MRKRNDIVDGIKAGRAKWEPPSIRRLDKDGWAAQNLLAVHRLKIAKERKWAYRRAEWKLLAAVLFWRPPPKYRVRWGRVWAARAALAVLLAMTAGSVFAA